MYVYYCILNWINLLYITHILSLKFRNIDYIKNENTFIIFIKIENKNCNHILSSNVFKASPKGRKRYTDHDNNI